MDGNGETTMFHVKFWNHPIETTIFLKWMLQLNYRPCLKAPKKVFFFRSEKGKNEKGDYQRFVPHQQKPILSSYKKTRPS